jgi:UrcA family protein
MSSACRATIVAGLCATLLAGQAAAQNPSRSDDVVSRTLKYSEADLHSAAGAQRLAARITYAADYVCGGDSLLLRFTPSFKRCRRAAAQRAAARLNAPLVAEALGIRSTDVAAR